MVKTGSILAAIVKGDYHRLMRIYSASEYAIDPLSDDLAYGATKAGKERSGYFIPARELCHEPQPVRAINIDGFLLWIDYPVFLH
jgi:hypothetical protein